MNYRRLSKSEFHDLSSKDSFNLEDVKKLAGFIPKSLESEFRSPLTSEEKKLIMQLVCKNILKIVTVFTKINENPNQYDHLIPKPDLNHIIEKFDIDNSVLIPCKATFIVSDGKVNEYTFYGKIPKKGVFSSRQNIANKWMKEFTEHLGYYIISQVIKKTDDRVSTVPVALAYFVAYYLTNNYQVDFKDSDSVYDLNKQMVIIAES